MEGECVCLDARPSPASPASLPLVDGTETDGQPIACTLAPHQVSGRMDDWQQLLDRAVAQEPVSDGVPLWLWARYASGLGYPCGQSSDTVTSVRADVRPSILVGASVAGRDR